MRTDFIKYSQDYPAQALLLRADYMFRKGFELMVENDLEELAEFEMDMRFTSERNNVFEVLNA
jgi:hypothetical protein